MVFYFVFVVHEVGAAMRNAVEHLHGHKIAYLGPMQAFDSLPTRLPNWQALPTYTLPSFSLYNDGMAVIWHI